MIRPLAMSCGVGASGIPRAAPLAANCFSRRRQWRRTGMRSQGPTRVCHRAGRTGTLDDRAVAWTSREARRVTSEVPTPAYYDGDFFVLSDSRKCLARMASDTGKVKWLISAPGHAKYEASPLAADGKIYLINFEGQVSVISAAGGKVLHVIAMDQPADGEMVRALISAAHGQLFIRTTRKLYCIGKGQE